MTQPGFGQEILPFKPTDANGSHNQPGCGGRNVTGKFLFHPSRTTRHGEEWNIFPYRGDRWLYLVVPPVWPALYLLFRAVKRMLEKKRCSNLYHYSFSGCDAGPCRGRILKLIKIS